MQPAGAGPDDRRLLGTICEKLGQLPAGAINVLVVVSPGAAYEPQDAARAMQGAAARMSPEDEQVVLQRGYRSARDFRQQAQRLSAVLLRRGEAAEESGGLWLNPGARHPLPGELARVLLAGE